jgi:hypothetical protein
MMRGVSGDGPGVVGVGKQWAVHSAETPTLDLFVDEGMEAPHRAPFRFPDRPFHSRERIPERVEPIREPDPILRAWCLLDEVVDLSLFDPASIHDLETRERREAGESRREITHHPEIAKRGRSAPAEIAKRVDPASARLERRMEPQVPIQESLAALALVRQPDAQAETSGAVVPVAGVREGRRGVDLHDTGHAFGVVHIEPTDQIPVVAQAGRAA